MLTKRIKVNANAIRLHTSNGRGSVGLNVPAPLARMLAEMTEEKGDLLFDCLACMTARASTSFR